MLTKAKEMVLHRWLRPSNGVLDSKGPLSHTIPSKVITEVNKELKNVSQTKKSGPYLSFTADEKARVAKYGSTNGVRAAFRRFSDELGKDLNENTMRDWVKAYQKEPQKKRKSMEFGGDHELVVTELSRKMRGSPFFLGE